MAAIDWVCDSLQKWTELIDRSSSRCQVRAVDAAQNVINDEIHVRTRSFDLRVHAPGSIRISESGSSPAGQLDDIDSSIETLRNPEQRPRVGDEVRYLIEIRLQRLDCPHRGQLPGGIGIECQHDPFGQSFDEVDLRFRQRRSHCSDNIAKPKLMGCR